MKHKCWSLVLLDTNINRIVWVGVDLEDVTYNFRDVYYGVDTPVSEEAKLWAGRDGYFLVEVEVDDG